MNLGVLHSWELSSKVIAEQHHARVLGMSSSSFLDVVSRVDEGDGNNPHAVVSGFGYSIGDGGAVNRN